MTSESTKEESTKGSSPVASAVEEANTVSREHELIKIDPVEERRVVRKLDLCLIPLMTMFYLLSFLDRANIGNARVAGLQKDLGLTDHEYQIAVTVLYVPYICAELPSNLLLRKLGPKLVMPTILTIWGMVCALQGTVSSFAGLVVIRAFLGLVEGPMFPGIVLYLSGFYTRTELSLRIAMFFSAASLSGAFSGLLAAAIDNMDGVNGRPGWAWIFILEGSFTIGVGLLSFFVTPSTPQDLRLFSQREKDIVVQRLVRDRPTTTPLDTFSFKQVWWSVSSPQVLLVFVALFMNGTTLYGLALFLPSIVNRLGYSKTHTQLVSVGPFAAGFAVTIITAFLSDRYKKRAAFAALNSIIAMTGFVVFLRSDSKAQSYGSLFLSVSGTYALPPILSAWMANNSEPHYRRATSVAMGFIATNSGGILSTWLFPSKEAPRFRKATIIDITFSALILVFSVLNILYLTWTTQRKTERRDELLAPYLEGDGVGEKVGGSPGVGVREDGGDDAWVELGDRHPDFRYAL